MFLECNNVIKNVVIRWTTLTRKQVVACVLVDDLVIFVEVVR